jgi:putative phosphoesterase
MRVALLSDIHGNLVSLEAVLADLKEAAPDAIICLGDVAVTGPQPRQVIARLRQFNWPIVMGNTDAWLLNPQPWNTTDEEALRLLAIEQWSALMMELEDLDFIRTFQPTVAWDLTAGQNMLCYHGSPRSNTDLIKPETAEEELIEKFAGHRPTILAGGHTHRQMLRRFESCLLINPGSVGLPLDQL